MRTPLLPLLLLPLLLLLLLPTLAPAQPFRLVTGFDLVDARGQSLGLVTPGHMVGTQQGVGIYLLFPRGPYGLGFSSDFGFFVNDGAYYTSLTCDGPPLSENRRTVFVAAPGQTVYILDLNTPRANLLVRARLELGRCVPLTPAVVRRVSTYKPMVNLEEHFTPPFRIRTLTE